jgi:hypothetical protein
VNRFRDRRSIAALAEVARERAVPWGAERAARVEADILRGRERSRFMMPLAQLALGGLGGLALFISLTHVSRAIRQDAREHGAAVSMPALSMPALSGSTSTVRGVAAPEPIELDRPVGDGGFADAD